MKKRIISCLSMAVAGCLMVSTPVFAQGDDPEASTETSTEILEENPGDTEVTTEESSDALSFDGTGTVVDNVQQGSKQFYTISTDAGNVFYLIIDLDKDSNNVYFLDTTKERDLLALAEQAEEESGVTTSTEAQTTTEGSDEETTTTEETSEGDETTADEANNQQTQAAGVPWGMLLIVLIAGAGVVVYYWIIKPKKDREEAEEFEETFDFIDDEITPDDSYEEEDTYGRIGGEDE